MQDKPDHFWAKCLIAICDLNSKPPRPAEARTNLTGCLQSHPDLPWLYLLRGFAYGQLGASMTNPALAKPHFDAAFADYREEARRDSAGRYRYALLVNRGLLHFQARQSADAIDDLEEAIALNPRQVNAYVTLAQVHRRDRRLDLAIEKLSVAISLDANQPALYRMRARWALEKPDVTPQVRCTALADLREAVNREPEDREVRADLHAEIARLLLLEREFHEALGACDASLSENPSNTEVQRYRVVALLELNRHAEALECCERYLSSAQKSPVLLGLRGLAKSKRNDHSGAIEDYTLAIAQKPVDAVLRRAGAGLFW